MIPDCQHRVARDLLCPPQKPESLVVAGLGAAHAPVQRRTVSMLWLKTSGRAASTVRSASSSTPRKSGVSTSTDAAGSFALSARIVAAKWPAPRSGMSSRSTDVTTTCYEPHLRGGLREP